MQDFCLSAALRMYEDPSIPAWGPDEEEIDPPTWRVSDTETDPSLPGEGLRRHPMLVIGEGCNRMSVVLHGKVAWTFCAGKGWEFDDAWMLPNGNILFSHMYWCGEVTPQKRLVWRYQVPEGCEIHALQPLADNRVLMMMNREPEPLALIVNRTTGAVEWEHTVPHAPIVSPHGQFRRFRLTADGTFLVPYLSLGRVVEYDKDFHELWAYEMEGPWATVKLRNGHYLITGEKEGVHREVNQQGDTVWEIRLDELPEQYRLADSQTCTRLDNGNTILCSRGAEGHAPQMVEVTADKQVVWVIDDWKNFGPVTAVQILDEQGNPEKPGECQR